MPRLQDSQLKPSSTLSCLHGVGLSSLSVMRLVGLSSPQLLCYFSHTVLKIKRAGLSVINQSRSLVWPQRYPCQSTAHIHIRQRREARVNGSVFQKPRQFSPHAGLKERKQRERCDGLRIAATLPVPHRHSQAPGWRTAMQSHPPTLRLEPGCQIAVTAGEGLHASNCKALAQSWYIS